MTRDPCSVTARELEEEDFANMMLGEQEADEAAWNKLFTQLAEDVRKFRDRFPTGFPLQHHRQRDVEELVNDFIINTPATMQDALDLAQGVLL